MVSHVVHCTWKRTRGGYRVWVIDRPTVSAEGQTFDRADEDLWVAVMEATGDTEATIEYLPVRPGPTAKGLDQVVHKVVGEGQAVLTNRDALFTEGQCPRCGLGRGVRSETPARLAKVPRASNGVRTRGIQRYFFSERFLSLLLPEERLQLSLRQAETKRGGALRLFELLGGREQAPLVALKSDIGGMWGVSLVGLAAPDLWRCDDCGQDGDPGYLFPQSRRLPFQYIKVPAEPFSGCFVAGALGRPFLCLTTERWTELVQRPGTQGLVSYPVGVVAPELVEANPHRIPLSIAAERKL